MKILLSNDDGYGSDGIRILDSVLTNAGHEVWVCAPTSQKSACSHAVSLKRELKICRMAERRYSCQGFPADCVLFALLGAIPMGRPDVVISGINHGYNVSTDLVYSGTAGAASEGSLRGFPAIAVSCDWRADNALYEQTACFVASHLDDFVKICPPQCYVNINVPENADGRWKAATLGNIEYHDGIISGEDEGFLLDGVEKPSMYEPYESSTDYALVRDQATIAVSCVRVLPALDASAQEQLARLQKLEESLP